MVTENKKWFVIRYDLQSADEAGAKEHPQRVVEAMGININRYHSGAIGGCVFIEIDKLPEPLPRYMQLSKYSFDKGY